MELHGFHGQVAVADSHNHAVIGFRGHFQACGERVANGEQRMVAAWTLLTPDNTSPQPRGNRYGSPGRPRIGTKAVGVGRCAQRLQPPRSRVA